MARYRVVIECDHSSKVRLQELLAEFGQENDLKLKVKELAKASSPPKPKVETVGVGYVFMRDDEEESRFFVTSIDYWKKHGCIDDQDPPIEMPAGFTNCMESCYDYMGEYHDPGQILKDAGFREVVWGEKID